MKALSFPPFRITFACLWAVILMSGLQSAKGYITDCGKPIMLAEVKFKDATLEEAVEHLKQAVKKLSVFREEYINVIILGASEEQKKKRMSLDARMISLQTAVDHIARSAGLLVRLDAHAIVLAPASHANELSTRIYRVPPYFLQAGSVAK